jgi:hypothetical protein
MIRPSTEELLKFNSYYPKDTDYATHARLLQSKWREKKGYPGLKYGNFLDIDFAKSSKANFLTDNIKQIVTDSIANAEVEGGMIGEPRIWNNLLSSQPLCFNLFGELHYNLDLATKYFRELFPNRIETVKSIKFEFSKGRGNIDYTGDHSAFDVFLEYSNAGKNGFIGIEVKYSESLNEEPKEKANETFLKHQKEYTRLTNSQTFKQNSIESLKEIPLSQIWRNHLLSIAHLKDYDEGFFVFLFPKENSHCQNGVDEYKKHLVSETEEQSGFYARYLDDFIRTLRSLHNTNWAGELEERYLGTNYVR